MKRDPEEILDADHELVIERVCAIDVAKANGAVCVRVPHDAKPGRRVSRVWQVPATTRAITDLAGQLLAEQVAKVTVESPGLLADLVLSAGSGRTGCAAGQRPGREKPPR